MGRWIDCSDLKELYLRDSKGSSDRELKVFVLAQGALGG